MIKQELLVPSLPTSAMTSVQLTPATSPEDCCDKLEWTYLEPAAIGAAAQSPVLLPSLSRGMVPDAMGWNDWAGLHAIKTEPMTEALPGPMPLPAFSSIPVQLKKREYPYAMSTEGPLPAKRAVPAVDLAPEEMPDCGPRLCFVCGEKAGKHSYYGGQVCPSCRAFFRRSVQSKYSDVYACGKAGACSITLKTRKNCQFCRFKLCEQAGMKRSWVLADGDRKKRGEKRADNAERRRALAQMAAKK
jgi:hypothetical protein